MHQNNPLFSLSIDPLTKAHLNDTARWAMFLAISGMVVLVLMVVFAFLTATIWTDNNSFRFTVDGREGEQLSTAMRIGYLIGMLIVAVLAFFPLLFLLQFANKLRTALSANQQGELNTAFLNLKKYFRYVGVILIIVLTFYALVLIMAVIFGQGT